MGGPGDVDIGLMLVSCDLLRSMALYLPISTVACTYDVVATRGKNAGMLINSAFRVGLP